MRSIMGSKILSTDIEEDEVTEAASEDAGEMTSQRIEDWLTSLQSRFDDLAGRRFGANVAD